MLPNILPNWRAKHYADGIGLFPPEGRSHGGIRIRDRRRPLRAARDLERAAMADWNMTGVDASAIERLTTAEGEYAAVVSITGTSPDHQFERHLGFVFGDDFYTQIDGVTTIPSLYEFFRRATRELIYYYSIGLGELRRRRYYYRPPPGWMGYPRGLITEWHPPTFPDRKASIAAFPARPVVESPAGVLDRALHELNWEGFARTQVDEAEPLLTGGNLSGVLWRAAGTYGGGLVVHQDIAALQDERFYYVARLESTAEKIVDDRLIFHEFLDSIEPLPHPEQRPVLAEDLMRHWTD